ncbi:iron-containing alcohol dehydrogenase [Desulfoluna limicola]|uniref:Iron-containing alcohol dehydrogenase n=1 Tax=Desulfoluna limicola TaxID=2810562 RepID=A0ABM7PD32_9BACT|nr:alcohol dehydrogenase-like regulatory protein ErcA [Desulfoluna limicola]BCS95009.1 iron-containing alcohol dehydrogenase [Desulfoluna limicola]
MLDLRTFASPEIVFGLGALKLSGQYAKKFGAQKALVVSDCRVVKAGWTERVCEMLEQEGIATTLFSEISPPPRDSEIMAGAELYNKETCDVIVAVGSGNTMDCAKTIGIVSTNNRNVLAFEGINKVDVPAPPLICIPTTAGSSSDVSQYAFITDSQKRSTVSIIDKAIVPDVTLIDPETTITMGAYLTACTGMDALVHAIEAFVSSANSPLTDLLALEAIRLIHGNLVKATETPNDLEVRKKLMLGSLKAGLAFSNAGLGTVHAMAHSIGGPHHLSHGECNGILLNHVIAYNYNAVPERFDAIGEALGIDDIKSRPKCQRLDAILAPLTELKDTLGIRKTFGDHGVQKEDIPELSRKALHDACMVTNPKQPTLRDLQGLYEESF